MRTNILIFLFCGLVSFAQEKKQPENKLTGFSHPESVVFDESREKIYVSNIGEKEEGDGFISRLSKDAEIEELFWITGLNDPKGLLVIDNLLYVTDVTEVVEMDIESGEIIRRIPIEGAQSLNDPAKDESGNIYVSDLAKSSIYMIKPSGEVEEWLSSSDLKRPNGLFVKDDVILVASWGEDEPGHLLKVDRKTKNVERITTSGIGNLDGIQKADEDKYYVSDWNSGKIYLIEMDGTSEEILTSEKSAGDILFKKDQKKLYLPMNRQNEVWIYSID